MRSLVSLLCVLGAVAPAAAAPIVVSFEPATDTVAVGETVQVDIIADIPEPVLGWGLDVGFDASVLSLAGAPVIGSDWSAAPSADGDGLAGLAFPSAISGDDVLLASLTFEAIAAGTSALEGSVTSGDLTEGFALASSPGAFGEVSFETGVVEAPIPEPGGATLFVAGVLTFAACGGRRPRARA